MREVFQKRDAKREEVKITEKNKNNELEKSSSEKSEDKDTSVEYKIPKARIKNSESVGPKRKLVWKRKKEKIITITTAPTAPPVPPPYIPPFEEKESKWQRPENKRLLKRSSILIGLFMIPALLCIYFISPLSRLKDVSVSGNEAVPAGEIQQKTNFTIGKGVWSQFFSRKDKIELLKKQEPRIKSAKVGFDGINSFNINIKEYREVALLAQDNKYAPIIENGHVIPETIEEADGSVPILENFTDSKNILKVLNQYKELSEEVKVGISQIKHVPTQNNPELLHIYMNDGNQVMINIPDISKKMPYYPQIAKEMDGKGFKGIVDMQVGIYSYPYPSPEESADTSGDSGTGATEETTSTDVNNEADPGTGNQENPVETPTENPQENS